MDDFKRRLRNMQPGECTPCHKERYKGWVTESENKYWPDDELRHTMDKIAIETGCRWIAGKTPGKSFFIKES